MRLLHKVLISALVILFFVNNAWITYNIQPIQKIRVRRLENKLQEVTVKIYNITAGGLGSGVIIKYNKEFYILSARHIISSPQDIVVYGEKDTILGMLEIVKYSPIEQNLMDNEKLDLLLLKPKNKDFRPKYYVELAKNEIQPPSQVYIVGNPAGNEDVLCEGRLIKYTDNFIYYINHTYFGNSGGGVFTKEGKLLGIVSHISAVSHHFQIPPYLIYGAVRLDAIKLFLKDVK